MASAKQAMRKGSHRRSRGADFAALGGQRPAHALALVAVLLGLLARGASLSRAPRYSYTWDHIDFLAWSAYASAHGATEIYAFDNHDQAVAYLVQNKLGQPVPALMGVPHTCNYPPLSTWVFAAQGWLWRLLQSELTDDELKPLVGGRVPEPHLVSRRLLNTHTARFVGALPSILCDFLLAWGVARLVRALRTSRSLDDSRDTRPSWQHVPGGPRAERKAAPQSSATLHETAAFALVLLAPPIVLDSSFWNQADAWVAAPLVWCLYFVLQRRFIAAGLIFGLALLIKPQALLLMPVFLFASLALRFMPGGGWKDMLGPVKLGVVAAVVALAVALPHSLATSKLAPRPGEQGWHNLLWFKRSYLQTAFGDLYPRVTLNAFNIWWFSYAAPTASRASGRLTEREWLDAIDPKQPAFRLGHLMVTRDAFGNLLLAASVVLTWILCARKLRWGPEGWVACAFLVMLAVFLLPTRVHERYIYFCLPFLIALAVYRRVWLTPLTILVLVGTFEMTSFRWVDSHNLADEATRTFANVLAMLAVVALAWSYAVLLLPQRRGLV